MKNICEINAFLEESGKVIEFYLTISIPLFDQEGQDFYCTVHSPALFLKDKQIYGVDEAQAKKLAVEFISRMLSGRRLVDMDGKPIDLASSMTVLPAEPNQ
jgi:hypothetical protein